MVDFDLIAWAESGAAAGLTARTGVTDDKYRTSADTQQLRAMNLNTYLAAMWGGSVTAAKLEGLELVSPNKIINDFAVASTRDGMPPALLGSSLVPEDTLTGYIDNAGTAEISALIAAIAYGDPTIYSPLPIAAGGSVLRLDSTTDTAGALPVGWVTASTTWTGLKPKKEYAIIGIGGWGTLDVALRLISTGGQHEKFKPGVPLGTTPAFACMTYFAKPYRFIGSSPPTIQIQSLGASAEHHIAVHLI